MISIYRSSLNSKAIRIVYNILFQYRKLGEFLIHFSQTTSNAEIELRAIRCAKFFRYYAGVSAMLGIEFLVETIAQDLRVFCETAYYYHR